MKRVSAAAALAAALLATGCGGSSLPQTVAADAPQSPAAPAVPGEAMQEPTGLYTDPASANKAAPPPPPVISPQAEAAAAKVADKAKKEERLDKSTKIGSDFLTPAPAAIKARHGADEAEAAAVSAHPRPAGKVNGAAKARADQRAFALFTGGPRRMNADGSPGPHALENQPVWVITYANVVMAPVGQPSPVPGLPPGDGPAGLTPASSAPETVAPFRIIGTVTVIVDDVTGESLMEISEGRDAP